MGGAAYPFIFSLCCANFLLPLALWIFSSGFFPHKTYLPGKNSVEHLHPKMKPTESPFHKVILMVVDALRSLVRDGAALPFTAYATSPTVTMPRLKAMTTGSVPSFLDMLLNVIESDTSSTLANQDSWIEQLRSSSAAKVIMYGDDTWLKLFPQTFARSEGTSSFFVSDYTEVDNNVTRHIENELVQSDWSGMILHYLGLDHIGHKSGPKSVNMQPKQMEMDSIVRQIYHALETKDHLKSTLLILCGDHGMNEAGNHGGSGAGEVSPALVFVSPMFPKVFGGEPCPLPAKLQNFDYYALVQQSDIVPTLSGLLGIPIPRNNLGVFIPKFLQMWEHSTDRNAILWQNADQMFNIVNETISLSKTDVPLLNNSCQDHDNDAASLFCQWSLLKSRASSERQEALELSSKLLELLYAAQDHLKTSATSYNMAKLLSGVAVAASSLLMSVRAMLSQRALHLSSLLWALALGIFYCTSMFGSSYVEEEQQLWYWFAPFWISWLYIRCFSQRFRRERKAPTWAVLILFFARLTFRWNQTGQKHAGNKDISRNFLPKHLSVFWILVASSYLAVILRFSNYKTPYNALDLFFFFLGGLSAVIAASFKIVFTLHDSPELIPKQMQILARSLAVIDLVSWARILFSTLLLCLAILLFSSSKASTPRAASTATTKTSISHLKIKTRSYSSISILHAIFSLLLMTQTRVSNVPLFLFFAVQLWALDNIGLSDSEVAITSLTFQHSSYFLFGGSNAVSSIDLSNSYNGVSSFNAIAVGALTFVSNWAGPIWWSTGILSITLDSELSQPESFVRYLWILTTFSAAAAVSAMLACVFLRSHLFIWTVFSPKYLFCIAWVVGQHICTNIFIGLGITRLRSES